MEFAKSLVQKDIYEAIQQAEPVGPIYSYARTENVRRRYEQVNQHTLDQLSKTEVLRFRRSQKPPSSDMC